MSIDSMESGLMIEDMKFGQGGVAVADSRPEAIVECVCLACHSCDTEADGDSMAFLVTSAF